MKILINTVNKGSNAILAEYGRNFNMERESLILKLSTELKGTDGAIEAITAHLADGGTVRW